VPSANQVPRRYLLLKGALLAFLAGNTAVYLISGTVSQALDSVAWLALLVSFELETVKPDRYRAHQTAIALRGVRLLAAIALAAAEVGYVRDKEWLDATNVGLWIAVVGLLEFEVRRPDIVIRRRSGFLAAAAVLYAGLAGLVLAWLLRGEWFDAYDAALWLVAFATLDMELIGQFSNGHSAT